MPYDKIRDCYTLLIHQEEEHEQKSPIEMLEMNEEKAEEDVSQSKSKSSSQGLDICSIFNLSIEIALETPTRSRKRKERDASDLIPSNKSAKTIDSLRVVSNVHQLGLLINQLAVRFSVHPNVVFHALYIYSGNVEHAIDYLDKKSEFYETKVVFI